MRKCLFLLVLFCINCCLFNSHKRQYITLVLQSSIHNLLLNNVSYSLEVFLCTNDDVTVIITIGDNKSLLLPFMAPKINLI